MTDITDADREAELIDAIINAYHTTRLSDTPFAQHIAGKPMVKAAFDRLRKTRDAEICAWLRSGDAHGPIGCIADAIERGEV